MKRQDQPFIDLKELGMLKAVNLNSGVKQCSRHGAKIECIFDTGIVMYVPEAIFNTMLLHLEEAS